MKSERSSRKQHFFSDFEQIQLKMRWKVLNISLISNKSIKTENKFEKLWFEHVYSFQTTKYTEIRTFQRIFSWICSKSEKKCCFLEERSDFILSQISEFLSDFAHFEIWWRWNFVFLGETEKKRFWAFWALNNLQIAKMPQKFSWAIMASEGNPRSKMAKILIFPRFSKVSKFSFIIFQNGQNPTRIRSCGPF